MAVKINIDMPKSCVGCPLRHWVSDDPNGVEAYDICGISGEEIPFGITINGPKLKMDNCMLEEIENAQGR